MLVRQPSYHKRLANYPTAFEVIQSTIEADGSGMILMVALALVWIVIGICDGFVSFQRLDPDDHLPLPPF